MRAAASLATRQGRRRQGRFLVEGPRAVRDLLRAAADGAPYRVRALYATAEVLARDPDLTRLAPPSVVREASAAVVGAISDAATPQGVVAVVDVPPRRGAAGVGLGPVTAGAVLVEVQDPGNVGTVVRAADAAGASVVALTPGCADPYAPKTVRSTAGSLFHLPVVPDVDLDELVRAARSAGVRLLATDAGGDTDLDETAAAAAAGAGPLAGPHLWLLGNEGRGLATDALAAADDVVRIPIRGRAESLNLAMAATLVLFATARSRASR
ncbi:MAG: TrmH family RNA methyltransferase [Kineosporiaceae bacterium]